MSIQSNPVKIIIADDHPLIRYSLKAMLYDIPEFKLVGEAANGAELTELAKKLKPEIVIVDIKMPVMDGIEATKQLIKELPETDVIVLSMVDDEYTICNILEAGVKGYLLKDAMIDEVITAIKAVYNGERYFSKQIMNKITHIVAGLYGPHKNPSSNFSAKEIAVIKLICEEYSTKQIADHLSISKRAVDGVRDHILKKINAKNTAGLVVYALKNKIY